MSPPVEKLTLLGSATPVSVDLPWQLLPGKMQQALSGLDANADGDLTLGLDHSSGAELIYGQKSFHQLYRLLWGFAGVAPHNDRYKDRASLPDRSQAIEKIQDEIFQKKVLPLLGKNPSAEQYRSAQQILELSGDFRHLHSLGIQAWGDYVRSKNIAYVQVAEHLQGSARRFASEVREGLKLFDDIQIELEKIRPVLDKAEQKEFLRDIQRPYLIAGSQSPITADVPKLKNDGVVYFSVAVPKRYVEISKKRGEEVEASLLNYFNSVETLWAQIPADDPDRGGKKFSLAAQHVELDRPGPQDDPIDETSSFHIDQERLSRTLFKDHPMVYYRVGFRMPTAKAALGKQRIRPLDLLLELAPSKKGEEGRRRSIPRAFVLQDLSAGISRTLLISDTHMMEREWEIQPVMVTSLLNALAEGDKAAGEQAEAVDRFYLPNNELVLGLLEATNQRYQAGEVDRVILTGDLIDSVNDPITTESLAYGKTNVRTAAWILSTLQAPLHVVTGNHDHVGPTKPKSINSGNFVFQNSLRKLFEEHYDGYRYSGSLVWNALKRIATRPCPKGNDACFLWHTFQDTTSDGLHSTPADAFLVHQLKNSPYESYGFSIGHGNRLFGWPTEDEHLNYSYYLVEEAEDPVRQDILKRGVQYLKKIAPNGKGPQPKNFIAWLREMETAQSQGWRVMPFGHYPVFARDYKNDFQEVDMMSPRTAWAVRQTAYYYRFAEAGPVMPIFIAGHEHHYEVTVFDFDFMVLAKLLHAERHGHPDFTDEQLKKHLQEEAEKLKAKYLEEMKKILADPKEKDIYEKLDDLRHEWHLDDIIITQSVGEAGANGYPDPLVAEFNRDSVAFGKKYGTLFLTVPAAGPPSDSSTGSMRLNAHPVGRLTLDSYFHRIGPDQSFIQAKGSDLEAFRKTWWEEARAWDPAMEIAPFSPHKGKTKIKTIGPRGYREKSEWEFLPLVYQYPKKKLGLNLNFETTYGYLDQEFKTGLSLGGELRYPLAKRPNLILGGPNYLSVGGKYNFLNREPGAFVGLDWGLLRTDLSADKAGEGDWYFGGRALLHSVLPGEPGIGLAASVSPDGDWRLTANLNLSLTIFTRRPRDRFSR